ncbi:MAG: hypothetical protein IJD40_13435 [Lachnospiraceae bacterium]|nr:hypothetical protein [Lachnospiraceae bacterium]
MAFVSKKNRGYRELENMKQKLLIDFERECVVYGKGDKERKAYFDAKIKIHLLNYHWLVEFHFL